MNVREFLDKVESCKGSNLSAVWVRSVKTRKGVEDVVEKKTTAVVRGGIAYDNLHKVSVARENGTLPVENDGLPWGEWVDFPYHIAHKGNDYLRLYPASGIEFTPKTTYYLNGEEVGKDIVKPLCLASEFKGNEENPLCFTIKADSLVSIG